MGVSAGIEFPFRFLEEAKGEMQMILDMPFLGLLTASASLRLGVSPVRGKPATSEKKKDELTIGEPGVRGTIGPFGVFMIEFKPPPGEKSPLAVGDCNQFKTFEVSKIPGRGLFP